MLELDSNSGLEALVCHKEIKFAAVWLTGLESNLETLIHLGSHPRECELEVSLGVEDRPDLGQPRQDGLDVDEFVGHLPSIRGAREPGSSYALTRRP